MPFLLDTNSARRGILVALSATPVLAIGGCATTMGRYSLEEGVRRLLEMSTQRAFARLTQPGGFYDDQLTRIIVPDLGGQGGAILSAILRTNAVRDRVGRALNDVAVDLADGAAPVVLDAVRSMSLADAVSVLRGGPTTATDLLARNARSAVVEALLPGALRALHSDLFEILSTALSASSGRDLSAMADSVSGQIGDAIFRAIGREEAAIRANPRETRDPVLIALLAV
ncbi:DUF4197 domain-containing protein [Sphingobium sp. BHU LFT2]|uniref:DUF4197 domain-containing protein n=1 Tax=Sphingobium sp. BHU LFT2 TaxID=2807634 RepID=UPI001BEB33A3|nr:DUF4197 domain-containing protein [Sphingobium sp. BHU LFT2]MBT2245982.1 DUF4197 domain-containing protein [Sphingobium sp. BHU LFT2]